MTIKYKNPYGDYSFENFNKENAAFVDKTGFIEVIDNLDTKYPVLLRPRRFGKTTFVQMLLCFYDISIKDKSIIVGALGYLFSPLVVIPDAIPIAGLGDDLAVLVYVLNKGWGNVSEDIKSQAKEKLAKWFDEDEIEEANDLFGKSE